MAEIGETVTISVSDEVKRHATLVATRSRRPVEDVLSDWREWAVSEVPVETLPDEQVLVLADSGMPAVHMNTSRSAGG